MSKMFLKIPSFDKPLKIYLKKWHKYKQKFLPVCLSIVWVNWLIGGGTFNLFCNTAFCLWIRIYLGHFTNLDKSRGGWISWPKNKYEMLGTPIHNNKLMEHLLNYQHVDKQFKICNEIIYDKFPVTVSLLKYSNKYTHQFRNFWFSFQRVDHYPSWLLLFSQLKVEVLPSFQLFSWATILQYFIPPAPFQMFYLHVYEYK